MRCRVFGHGVSWVVNQDMGCKGFIQIRWRFVTVDVDVWVSTVEVILANFECERTSSQFVSRGTYLIPGLDICVTIGQVIEIRLGFFWRS